MRALGGVNRSSVVDRPQPSFDDTAIASGTRGDTIGKNIKAFSLAAMPAAEAAVTGSSLSAPLARTVKA